MKSVEREALINNFLKNIFEKEISRIKIPGDASFRSYERIITPINSYILMDAPPSYEDVRPFIATGEFLYNHGFSAPLIIEKDTDNGLLLLEDLGYHSFSRMTIQNPEQEEEIYLEAVNLLMRLHKTPINIHQKQYDNELLLQEVMLYPNWYDDKINQNDFANCWMELFQILSSHNQVLVLRDYHADNLMWLENRNGDQKVGLLDFQDSVIGSKAYDLLSLLEDARRDVSRETHKKTINLYLESLDESEREQFLIDYQILAAQRNSKIIGIFARLAKRDGKSRYLDYLPRVIANLKNNLNHPIFKNLAHIILPE